MANYLDGMEGGKHNSDNIEVSKKIKTFSVSITFTDMVAKTPLEAAKKACKWLLENEDAKNMIYDVTDEQTNKSFSVDLSEEDKDAVLPN
jgi:GTP cyclohydrolase III